MNETAHDQIKNDSQQIAHSLGGKVNLLTEKRILLTGAFGFLGYHFLSLFRLINRTTTVQKRLKVFAIDNFKRGSPAWLNEFEADDEIEIIGENIVDYKDFPEVDYVIHAASIASPTYYRLHPIETMEANVLGLRNLLEAYKGSCIESFLFFSTSEIYGDPSPGDIPTPETYRGNVSCTGPRACYDESKRFGETLCVNYWKEKGLPIKIVRPFNNYGPGLSLSDKRIIPDLFLNVLEKQDVVLLSDGKATRTFCYISDAVTGYLLALLSDANGEAFNIGNDSGEISMNSLAQKVVQLTGADSSILYKESNDLDYTTDNPNRRCPNIEKARKVLGFQPKVELEEGLARTWNYYQKVARR